jgi:hypothetical protein
MARPVRLIWLLAILCLLAPLAPASGRHVAAAQTAACTTNPGVELLRAWAYDILPPYRAPEPQWRLLAHPTNPLFNVFYPEDWTGGELPPPDWMAGTWTALSWSGMRIVGPRGDAAIEAGTATIPGTIEPQDAAWSGLESLFGATGGLEILCAETTPSGALLVVDAGDSLAVATGYAWFEPSLGQTAYVYYAMAGSEQEFAGLTERVFVPVFYQFYRSGGTDSDAGGGDGEDDGEQTGDGESDDGDDDDGQSG